MADFDTQTQSEEISGQIVVDSQAMASQPIERAWGKLYKKNMKFKNLGIKRFKYNPKKTANKVIGAIK
jgi:hypothetical protein